MGGFIPWTSLRNPVFSMEHYAIKDACMAYRGGVFHLFFSAFDEERSSVAAVRTSDFRNFSDLNVLFDGREEGWIGMCSPDIAYVDGTYYLTFNSWGDAPEMPNQLFYMVSEDLEHWSERRPLAPEITAGVRAIDAALAWTGRYWVLMYRRGRPGYALWAEGIGGPWTVVGEARFDVRRGEAKMAMNENFQVMEIDGQWRLLSTDFGPHHPFLYTLDGSGEEPGHWVRWTDGYQLHIPEEPFNTVDRDNAAALCDWRDHDGYFYLIYAGKNEERRDCFRGTASSKPWPRGWSRLGLARSRDLVTWTPAGQEPPTV